MRRFLVVVEKGEGNFAAYSPDLPGCVTAGETIEEVERNMYEAIQFHLRGLEADDLPIPEPTTMLAEYMAIP